MDEFPQVVSIQPKQEGKGRTFSATCLAVIEATSLSPFQSGGDDMRPVLATFAATDTALRPFVTNLQLGRKADLPGRHSGHMEFLRSAGYQTLVQRETEGSIATMMLPDLFRMDPGMVDPQAIRFIVAPSNRWLRQEPQDRAEANEIRDDYVAAARHARRVIKDLRLTDDAVVRLAPLAYVFASYLDRRSRAPIVADGRFYLQLMLACLERGLAAFPNGSRADGRSPSYNDDRKSFGVARSSFGVFYAINTDAVGYGPIVGFNSTHDAFEALLAEQTRLFVQETQ